MENSLRRLCLEDFSRWFNQPSGRKPLLIRGARQIGKTTAVRLFAEELNLHLVELNMEKTWQFEPLITAKNPGKLVEAIEFELNTDIKSGSSILFFDEIQATPAILSLLRYFYEEMPGLAVIATGSLLEFSLSEPEFSLPVGRIELYHMGPFSFEEFLAALGHQKALNLINNYSIGDAIPEPFHRKMNQLVKLYSIVGGMPEAVAVFHKTSNFKDVERVKSGILETFVLDFNKYKGKADIRLLRKVFESLPLHIGRKVIYSHIDSNYRSRDLSLAVNQLGLAKVLTRVFHSSANGIPLAAEKNERFFKPLHLDIGLLLSQLNINPIEAEYIDDLNLINQGALGEQFIGQQLLHLIPAFRNPELYYWIREKKESSAEVDYLHADGTGRIIPIEVKSGKTGRLRSLQSFVTEKGSALAIRFNADFPSIFTEERDTPRGRVSFKLLSLPHYLVGRIDTYLKSL